MVRVLLFGKLRDIAGWRERVCDPPPGTLSDLKAMICEDDPALAAALAAPGVQAARTRKCRSARRLRGRLHAGNERRMIRLTRDRRFVSRGKRRETSGAGWPCLLRGWIGGTELE